MVENIILARLKLAYEKKINKIHINYSIKAVVFLKILKAEGFIYSFKNLNNTITIVLNHTNDIIPLLKIKTFSKISKPYFIKNKILVSKIKKFKNEIFIIQTDKGIISNKQILNLGIGGILIAVLS